MPRIDLEDFYRQAFASHGETAGGVHWNSTDSQEIRFATLRRLLPESLADQSIVDVGCGFGDFYRYLVRQGDAPGGYLGLDLLDHMVEIARRRTGREIRRCDALIDPLPEGDWFVCSGAMNNLTRPETETFIERCYAACGQGFVFNLLRGREDRSYYNLYEPAEILALGARLGARTSIRDGYLAHDFTAVFVR